MWEHLRDSVQARATTIVRDISGRLASGEHARPNDNSRRSEHDAMKNVVTPNNIPPFSLPPLVTVDGARGELHHRNTVDDLGKRLNDELTFGEPAKIRESPANSPGRSPTQRKRKQQQPSIDQELSVSQSEPHGPPVRNEKMSTQPGLSLQHLLSTKSGFTTLTESPNTKRKESLFLSGASSYHLTDLSSASPSGNSELTTISSSDSEVSRNASPSASPLLERLRNSRLLNRSNFDSDSNAAFHSPPFRSPSQKRKTSSKMIEEGKENEASPGVSLKNTSLDGAIRQTLAVNGDSGIKVKRSQSAASKFFNSVPLVGHDCGHQQAYRPRIHLMLTHDPVLQTLRVSFLECDRITGDRLFAYLKVSLLPRDHAASHRTDVFKAFDTPAPIKEEFTFDAVSTTDLSHLSLEITCKEKSSGIRHGKRVLGKSVIALRDINLKSPYNSWLELESAEIEELPHLELSVCYHAMLGFVTVDVIAARNVPKGPLGRYRDCYVALTEVPPNEKSPKQQTKVLQRTKDPEFKESFRIPMSSDHLAISATLFSRDRVKSHWVPSGSVNLGHSAESAKARHQWSEALANEGEPVKCWHVLEAADKHQKG